MRSSYLATQPCRRPPPGDPRGLGHGCPAHRSVAGSERWRTPARWGTGVERCRYLRCCRTVARDLSGNHDVVARRDAGSQAKVSRPTSRFSSSRQGLRFSWPRTQCFFKAPCRDASARREPRQWLHLSRALMCGPRRNLGWGECAQPASGASSSRWRSNRKLPYGRW